MWAPGLTKATTARSICSCTNAVFQVRIDARKFILGRPIQQRTTLLFWYNIFIFPILICQKPDFGLVNGIQSQNRGSSCTLPH